MNNKIHITHRVIATHSGEIINKYKWSGYGSRAEMANSKMIERSEIYGLAQAQEHWRELTLEPHVPSDAYTIERVTTETGMEFAKPFADPNAKQIGAVQMREIGRMIANKIKGLGFCLLVFEFGSKERLSNYISNGNREDIIATLKQTADRLDKGRELNTPEEN